MNRITENEYNSLVDDNEDVSDVTGNGDGSLIWTLVIACLFCAVVWFAAGSLIIQQLQKLFK